MMQNKKIIGITGGSGTGKSYLSEHLRRRGYLVIDADKTAHRSINGRECQAELVSFYGDGIKKCGKIDRKKLGEIVFSDREKLKKLNEITHKYILADIMAEAEKSDKPTVFVDGATLIESGMQCDKMIGVVADCKIRKTRIIERDGLTEEEAKRRLSSQPSDEFYLKHCDYVVENNGMELDIDKLIKNIL